jgi:hypothetical protein
VNAELRALMRRPRQLQFLFRAPAARGIEVRR